MRNRLIVPALEGLEGRTLLSVVATAPAVVSPPPLAAGEMLPAKKDKEDDQDKGKAKDKKPKDAPEVTVLLNGTPLIDGVGGVDFGRVTLGTSGAIRTFTVRNDGKKKLDVGFVSVPGAFTLLDSPAGHLGAGQSTTFSVRLDAAGSAGTRGGRIAFTTNDSDERNFDIGVGGTVAAKPVTPPPVVKPPVTPPPVAKSPRISVAIVRASRSALAVADGQSSPVVGFAAAIAGGASPTRTFRVSNTGSAVLKLGAVQVPAGFRVVEGLSTSIAPGASDTFTVRLLTTSAGRRSGRIAFSTNDPRAGTFDFAVSGAVGPRPAVSPAVAVSGTTLTVNGTAGADTIVVSGGGSAGVSVSIGGKALTGSPFRGVAKVVVNAGGGNDRVDFSGLTVNGTANGGAGNDVLIGSAGDDVLNGDGGDDVIGGGAGNDHLAGGDGADHLTGGGGVDALAGGSGDDVLDALDGISDANISGGGGSDVFRRDRVDPSPA
jgi:Ca2+-binding RTX toxin-like protein